MFDAHARVDRSSIKEFGRCLIIVLTLIYGQRAFAQCSASLTLEKYDDDRIRFTAIGEAASCPNNNSIELTLSYDGGPFLGLKDCNASPCQIVWTDGFACLKGTHTEVLRVRCGKAKPDGSCGIPDDPGFDTKTFSFDHTPAITNTEGIPDDGGSGYPTGAIHYHAKAVSGNLLVTGEWLFGSSGVNCCFTVYPEGDPFNTSDYWSPYSGSPDGSGSTALLLTVTECNDLKTFAVVNAVDNDCGTACGGSQCSAGPAACAGNPIRLSNGNMRMSERDPLPANEALFLGRTYDSRGVAGFFGSGWTSPFDAHLRIAQSQSLGTNFAEIRTPSNSKYIFQNADGGWLQVWPKGTTPAVLTPGAGIYTLREAQSTIETVYDAASGRLVRARSRSAGGREAVISYVNGLPAHVADSWGDWAWTIASDASNRISTITVDGTSLVWTYTYDGSGNLASVTGPGNSAWRTYTYTNQGLTEARDARGNLIESHAYSPNPFITRATQSLSDHDDITNIEYQLPGRDEFEKITRTTSGNGSTTDFYTRLIAGRPRTVQVVGHCATCGTNDAVYAYDNATGHLLREQDARGFITVRTFDTADRVLSIAGPYQPDGCDPLSDANHCRQTPASLLTATLSPTTSTLTTTFGYGDSTWTDVATLTTVASVLAPNQVRTTSAQLDPATGMVTQQVTTGLTGDPAQSVQYTATTTLYDGTEGAAFNPGGAFDAAWLSLPQPTGLRKSNDGPRTDVADTTTFVYYPIDAAVPASWRGQLAAVRNAAGHVTRLENYDVFGNAGRTIDPNGVVTEATFDPIGRLLTSTLKGVSGCDTTADPLCATDIVSSRTYQPALGPLASTTAPRGETTTYEYDARRRTTATTRQISTTAYERIEYDYDPATGHKSAERYLGGHPGAWTITRSDAFQYDSFARLSQIDHPDGTKIVYHYDGANNLISVQDERHTTPNTTYAYDPANRLSSVTQTLSTAPGGHIATAYAYDVHGNLTSVTDPNGNVTSYAYDDFGRMLRQTSPVTGVTNYTYDEAGNLISTTDANTATTTRSYDALGRVLTAISSRDSDTQQVTWTYDDATAGNYGIGRLASATSDDSSSSTHYDRRGLLREEMLSIEGEPFVQSYGYDADGNRTALVYPSGRIANYTFDFAGRPVAVAGSMSGSTTPYVTSASYLPFGPLTSLTFGNGTAETRTFDQRYSAATIQLSTAGGLLANYTYATDGAGNVTQINDLTDSAYNRTFGYDDLNRLISANSGVSLWGAGGYTYDPMGNMLTSALGSKTRFFTYTGATPLISTVSADGALTNMQYDAVGNELNGPAGNDDTRIYTPRNLLQQVDTTVPCQWPEPCRPGSVRTVTLWNGYDARGLRVESTQSGSRSLPPNLKCYFYTPELAQLATVSVDEDIESDVIWFGGRPVASDTTASPDPRFTFTDHLGTPILQTDTLANVVWRAEYEPFGNVFAMRTGGANDQRLRFPGQQVAFFNFAGDEENYNIFRWYRSSWGRYTQADPLGVAFSDANAFRYVGGNPLLYLDPSGLVTTRQTYSKRGTLTIPGDGFYSLGFGKAFATGECSGCGSRWHFKLTLNFDHGYYCTTANSCRIELWHANIASAFIASAAQYWNQYEKAEYPDKASCQAAAKYYANDLATNITNSNNWPDKLAKDYIRAQNDYEETHHGWGCNFFSGLCGAY